MKVTLAFYRGLTLQSKTWSDLTVSLNSETAIKLCILSLFGCFRASAAPPEFDAPTFYRVVSDTKLVLVLYPALPENGDITRYYVVVVPDELTHGRRSRDFKIDEV